MPSLIVVDDPVDWRHALPDVEVVSARQYLTDSSFVARRALKVFNLCRSYRYQSSGYYVSLLAAARGHRPLPGVQTIQDFKTPVIVRTISEELNELIQKSLGHLQCKDFTLSIYFGRNLAKRYDRLSRKLFGLFPAPMLRAQFSWSIRMSRWLLQSIGPVSVDDLPEDHHPFLLEAASSYFSGKGRPPKSKSPSRYDLAILVGPPDGDDLPSNARALNLFERAAQKQGFAVERIGRDDYGRLAEFDALFIRETTSVNHHTYRFARRAAAEGLVVVDDPDSIVKCTNKVFLAELLERHRLPRPKTLVVHRGNRERIADELGFPVVLKQPDSSFSQGVVKAVDPAQLKEHLDRLLCRSDLVIAQEYLPTSFDWRVGIFDRQPLYGCRYYMADEHWQILKRDDQGKKTEGRYDTLPVENLPTPVLRLALKAANLIGDGFYGVDLKQVGNRVYVIEVNDNPNIDAGVEDKVLKHELYERIMRVMLRRVERRKGKSL
ncbi:MAG: RimK family protein [Desulfuromonadales bacterium]|nr:RimK family protein [Desulfuromonadales bacterium]